MTDMELLEAWYNICKDKVLQGKLNGTLTMHDIEQLDYARRTWEREKSSTELGAPSTRVIE